MQRLSDTNDICRKAILRSINTWTDEQLIELADDDTKLDELIRKQSQVRAHYHDSFFILAHTFLFLVC